MDSNLLQLKTFGGLSLTGRPLTLRGAAQQRKPLALLALLAVAGDRGLTREKIAGLLWSESDEERARGNLKQALYALRKDSGQPGLILGTSTLRLNPAVITVDLAEFEVYSTAGRLAEAEARYAGPFLDGIFIEEAEEFERWSEGERQRLAVIHRRNLSQLAQQAENESDYNSAATWLGSLSREQPLDAGTTLRLMAALERSGDLVGAITAGETLQGRIREELGDEMPGEIAATLIRLREQSCDPTAMANLLALRPTPAAEASVEPPDLPAPRKARPGILAGATTLALVAVLAITAGKRWGAAPSGIGTALQSRETRPLVLVQRFELRAGPDSLAYLGNILTDRLALGLSGSGTARIATADSATPIHGVPADPDLTISGFYYTVNDSIVIEADVIGRRPLHRLITVPTTRGVLPQVNQAATILADAATAAVAQLFDSTKAQWGISADHPVTPRAYSWFLLTTGPRNPLDDCTEYRADLDSALAADSTFSLALIRGLNCAGSGNGFDFQPDSAGIDDLRARIVARHARLTPFEADLADYLSLEPYHDTEARLRIARRMRAELPASRYAALLLIDALTEANRFDEAIAIWRERDSAVAARRRRDEKVLPNLSLIDALHLAGRFHEELALIRTLSPDAPPAWRSMVAFQEIRALAALHDTAGLRAAIPRVLSHRSFSDEGIWPKHQFAEELATHGFQRLADSLTQGLSAQSCLHLGVADESNTLRKLANHDIPAAKGVPARLRLAERIQLNSARNHLRYGCQDDATKDLAVFRTPIVDSLAYQGVHGELLARQGNRAGAEAVVAWLVAHDPVTVRSAMIPPWSAVYARARIAAILGNRAEAFTLLSNAMLRGMPYHLKVHSDPLWRGFSEDPVFRTAVNR